MTDVFIIRNQLGHFWAKSKTWVSGSEPRTVYRAKHEDEALNTLVELSAKDIDLRGEVVSAELSERGEPLVKVSDIPVPGVDEEGTTDEDAADESAATANTESGNPVEPEPPAPI